MVVIDSRLKTCDTDQDVAENFNRTLALVDAGGGSGDSSVIFVTDTEGTLNIKPSDIIDTNGNFKDKLCILKYIVDNSISWILEVGTMVEGEDTITIVFGDSQNQLLYVSTISGDEYFTEAETSSPEIPNIGS